MAETFVFAIAGKVIDLLASPAFQRIGLAWGLRDELRKLQNTVSTVQKVLLDAEEQQATNHQLRYWLEELQDALYDADDVLDHFEIENLRRELFHNNVISKVRAFFSPSNQIAFRLKMGREIKKVRERFDEIAANKTKFNLSERTDEGAVRRREMTHSFVSESDVIGRDHDREKIIKLLTQKNDSENVSVIPIVGLGGLGKTALAKLVYNDNRVRDHFDLRIWVCTSDDFALRNVIIKILKSITKEDHWNLDTDQLQMRLREELGAKKYLLVLDDVWNEDRVKWNELRSLLLDRAAVGGKIIVTTRSKRVASVMATTVPIQLDGLPDKDCLRLLLKWAFRSKEDADRHQNLVGIGKEIVKKCKGVPLAVRTLGNLLYMKTEEHEWIRVRDDDIWKLEQKEDDILPALKLSFYQLPSHLKQCFAFCSLFPKDYEFFGLHLIILWRAQGLIKAEQNQVWQDIGKTYIEQLVFNGFFQEFTDFGDGTSFKMHDLVHDLALLVAKPYCMCVRSHDVPQTTGSRKVRHFSFLDARLLEDKTPSWLMDLPIEHARTLLSMDDFPKEAYRSFFMECISKFKCVRMIELMGDHVDALPSSIGSLKHLKYLNLSESKIKSLPDSICKLVGLEALALDYCDELEKLPKKFGKLVRLNILGITTKEMCLPEKEIICLTSLRDLCIYQCEHMEHILSDDGMQQLSALRRLEIIGCNSLVSLPIRGLRSLPMLEDLSISDCQSLELMMDEQDDLYHCETTEEEASLRGGFPRLLKLKFSKVPKLVGLPSWLLHGANSLKHIEIRSCRNLTTLASDGLLKNLKNLQTLYIHGCPQLTSLPKGLHHLTALNEIKISDCPELISQCEREITEGWHKISHVPNIYLDGVKF